MSYTSWSLTNFIRLPSGLITSTPLSASAWFYPTAAANGTILGFYTSGSAFNRNSFRLGIDTTPAVITLSADSTAVANATSTAGATLNSWNHAAGVWASATSRTSYLNGGNKTTETTSRIPSGINRVSIGIGDGTTSSTPFQSTGFISEVGIWNVALGDDEVLELSTGVPPILVRPQNLVAYIPLINSIQDYVGNAFAAVGSPTSAAHNRMYGASA